MAFCYDFYRMLGAGDKIAHSEHARKVCLPFFGSVRVYRSPLVKSDIRSVEAIIFWRLRNRRSHHVAVENKLGAFDRDRPAPPGIVRFAQFIFNQF